MKGLSTRGKNLKAIMNGQGFGDLTITREGVKVVVPQSWLFKDGRIKKYAEKAIEKQFKNKDAKAQ